MDDRFFVVADGSWTAGAGKNPYRMATQGLCPLGNAAGHLAPGCKLLVKFRDEAKVMQVDAVAHLELLGDEFFIKSERLARWVPRVATDARVLVYYFEGTKDDARCIVQPWNREQLSRVGDESRLVAFGLPPHETTCVDQDDLTGAMYDAGIADDAALFAPHADRFLAAPNIIAALFSHLLSIRTEDSIQFPIKVKKIAEQLRKELDGRNAEPRIMRITKSHIDLWSEAQGQRFSFLDGGAARIGALPGLSPMALRVGIYSVRPGIESQSERESWEMQPYVVADLLDRARRPPEPPERRRLQEAARYTLEALTGLLHVRRHPPPRALLMHGPLFNQFTQYDEGDPNYIPFLDPTFLAQAGITQAEIDASIFAVPSDSMGPMWNHFMAVYAYIALGLQQADTPIAGVVERATGRAVSIALIQTLEKQGVYTAEYTRKVKDILDEFDITDDFLFGCMLREGEYVTPLPVEKNPAHRAQPRWKPVVRQHPHVHAILLKSEETNFPFRIEMNVAATKDSAFLTRFLYHTARLLPRYAFPVGLDIADKYAKIPDWLSRGISTELSATVLRRAMKTGDPHLVTQLRLFLARGPRDFFFRPTVD